MSYTKRAVQALQETWRSLFLRFAARRSWGLVCHREIVFCGFAPGFYSKSTELEAFAEEITAGALHQAKFWENWCGLWPDIWKFPSLGPSFRSCAIWGGLWVTTNSKLFGGSRKIYSSLSRELQQLDSDCDQQNLKLLKVLGNSRSFRKVMLFALPGLIFLLFFCWRILKIPKCICCGWSGKIA